MAMTIVQRVLGLRRTLTGKFIAILSLVLLATISATAYVTYRLHLQISETEVSEQFAQRVQQVAARVDLRLQDIYRVSNQMVFNSEIIEAVTYEDAGKKLSSVASDQLTQILNQYLYSVPNLVGMYLYDFKGNYFMPSGSMLPYDFGNNIARRLDELLAGSDGELVWAKGSAFDDKIIYTGFSNNSPVVIAARYMKDQRANKYGILVLAMNEGILSNDLNKVIGGKGGQIYVLDKMGGMIYTDESLQNKAGIDLPLLQSIGETGRYRVDHAAYLYTQATAQQTKFRVIGRISIDELHRKSRILLQVAIAGALASILIAGLSVVPTIHRLLLPLRDVVRGMRRVQEGHLGTRIRVRTKDELAFIGEGFNAMVDNVESLIKEVYEKQLREREAELTALQAQLNPHFLHNTLDMFHSRLYLKDDRENAALIVHLSSMLRYALEPATSQTTVSAELEQLRHYLTLQQARYEDNLHIVIEADESVLRCRIVRLLLQPLVENSFVHGFRDITGARMLAIRVYPKDGMLLVEIEDNGCGMPAAPIDTVMPPHWAEEIPEGRGRAHIGLRNVIRRIELLHGPPHRLEIVSEAGSGTLMRLHLPYEQQEEANE
ncbi:cache domain-containing sensor histidine kinase [Paenibacillus cymbidii]|uniref:cache domain-containing sensor histidine kinase n=1 Tax=Paenibacillus cymbidii TaxID=1639034 RepID=UPI001081F1C5|nr:sensor histidine kinase [Paenibacillus cymbidii]